MKVNKKQEHLIGVVGPRHAGNYGTIMPAIIRAIDIVHDEKTDDKESFIFIHDGVTTGSAGEVIEVINKIQPSVQQFGYYVTYRKLPLDIELHGKNSHWEWVERMIALEPDLVLVFDTGEPYMRHAQRLAEKASIPGRMIKVNGK